MKLTKKVISGMLSVSLSVTLLTGIPFNVNSNGIKAKAESVAQAGTGYEEAIGINVKYHTQEEIRDYASKSNVSLNDALVFDEEPVTQSPYSLGKLSDNTLQSALKMLNQVRYIAGISDNVELSDEYNTLCQAGAVANYANDELSHFPGKPDGMSDEMYALAKDGASSSNIAWASWPGCSLNSTIVSSWLEDGDSSNIDRVGHRRWLINPNMGKTGFGAASGKNGTYSTVYSFDRSNSSATEYGVAWPAQNMPVEYFGKNFPWSVSIGDNVNETSVNVTLTRKNDNKTWNFQSSSADGSFYVNNDNYGQKGCIIFRPDNGITYNAGDVFKVEITGLDNPVSYTVSFFELNPAVNTPAPVVTPSPSATPTQKPEITPSPEVTQKPAESVSPSPDVTQKPIESTSPSPSAGSAQNPGGSNTGGENTGNSTQAPTQPGQKPTASPSPSAQPGQKPTASPSPSVRPTQKPTASPSPSVRPTQKPTASPSPSVRPTQKPTASPSPSVRPTHKPTANPSPSVKPGQKPTASPSPVVKATQTPAPAVPEETENVTNPDEGYEKPSGINVKYHTQEEIRNYALNSNVSLNDALEFDEEPVTKSPYSLGKLSGKTLQSALKMLNQIRYIAGISDNVELSDEYNTLCQAAAVANYANDSLSHFPEKPDGMSDDLYELATEGAGSSNIAWASWPGRSLNDTIISSWLEDGDSSNIDRVGHRRWLINPDMGKTGFGAASGKNGTYSTVYSFDRSNNSATEYGVAWPAQNMPVEYFGEDFPWSISMGYSIDSDNVNVKLTRKNDGKTWNFQDYSADGTFYVNNDGYGQKGCIIFRPESGITYNAGDVFKVEITGLENPVSYTVNFFNLSNSSGKDNSDKTDTVKTGIKITDKNSKAIYKITGTGKTKTVEYIKSTKPKPGNIKIPDSIKINGNVYKVTSIGKNAFKGNKKLKSVQIGKNIAFIGTKAFSGCKKLSSITVKTNKLTASNIGKNAFSKGYSKPKVKADKSKCKSYKSIFKSKGMSKKCKFIAL